MKNGKSTLIKYLVMLAVTLLASNSIAGTDEMKTYYERPGLSLSAYDKVLVDPLELSHAKVVPPPWVEGEDRNPRKWALTADDIAHARQAYRAAMKQQLEKEGGYPVVSEPGKGVLELSIAIVSLTPYARPDEKVITKGTGELIMQVELRDAMSRELLAIYEGPQSVGEEYQENTELSAEHNVNELFATWGKKVRAALDEDHGK